MLLFCIFLSPHGLFAQSCPPGTVAATASDFAAMQAAGIEKPKLGMCWQKSSDLVGDKAAAAKAFLISRYVIGPRSAPCIKTKEQGIGGLNSDFAIRVAQLIQDMESQLGGKNIVRSAYRPGACGGGVGHSHGCAVDIEWAHSGGWRPASDNPNVLETRWVIKNGGNTQYRIHHPFPYPPEWHHIEPMDRASCLAGRAIDPNVGGVQASPPSSGLTNTLRQALGMNTQPLLPPQPASSQSYSPPQQLPTQPSPVQPTQYFPPSNSGNTPLTNTQPTGNSPVPGINENTSASDLLSNLQTPQSSITEQLLYIAYGTSTATSSATTSVPIAFDTSDVAGIAGNTSSETHNTVPSSQESASFSPTTFTSPDLAFSGSLQGTEPSNAVTRVLADLRIAAKRILMVLRPFGMRTAVEQALYGDVYLE